MKNIAMRGVDLDAVNAGLLASLGSIGKPLDDAFDFADRHRPSNAAREARNRRDR